MKISEIIIANKFIADIELSKLDRTIRVSLLKNFMVFNNIVKNFESRIDELRKKMFGNRQEDIQKVQEIRECLQKSETSEEISLYTEKLKQYRDFLDLEEEFFQIFDNEISKEVNDVEVTTINMIDFVENLAINGIEFSSRDIDKLKIIFSIN